MTVDPENSRYDRLNVPESSWPDGSPVSNWSRAVAELNRTRETTALAVSAKPDEPVRLGG